jgi:hypothetical protein
MGGSKQKYPWEFKERIPSKILGKSVTEGKRIAPSLLQRYPEIRATPFMLEYNVVPLIFNGGSTG